jgi:hypothetical protein
MERILQQRYVEPLQAALDRLPLLIRRRLDHLDYLLGLDPVYAGLSKPWTDDDGRSNRDTGGCYYEFAQPIDRASRRTTVVMPDPDRLLAERGTQAAVAVYVHEFGHAIHELLGWPDVAMPCTIYARTAPNEAFAESFAARYCPDWYSHPTVRATTDRDARMRDLWERLERGETELRLPVSRKWFDLVPRVP